MAKKTPDKNTGKKKRDKKRGSVANASFDAQLRDAIRAVDVANLMTSPSGAPSKIFCMSPEMRSGRTKPPYSCAMEIVAG